MLRDFVAPITESPFGELHNVALVHQGHALALERDCVTNRAVNQANAARAADWLNTDADQNVVTLRSADSFPELGRFLTSAEADLVEFFWKFLLEKIENLLRTLTAGGVLNPSVDVFRVLAEDHHVDLLRVLHWRRHTAKELDWSQADVEIKKLS